MLWGLYSSTLMRDSLASPSQFEYTAVSTRKYKRVTIKEVTSVTFVFIRVTVLLEIKCNIGCVKRISHFFRLQIESLNRNAMKISDI